MKIDEDNGIFIIVIKGFIKDYSLLFYKWFIFCFLRQEFVKNIMKNQSKGTEHFVFFCNKFD